MPLLFHSCRPINLGGKTWASFCVFNGGVIILNRIKQSTRLQTPEQTVFTERSILRGGLFIYPRPAWTRFAQEPKLKNASPARQGGGLTVGGSLHRTVLLFLRCHILLPRLKPLPSLTWCRFPPHQKCRMGAHPPPPFCRWRLCISHSEGLSAAQSE